MCLGTVWRIQMMRLSAPSEPQDGIRWPATPFYWAPKRPPMTAVGYDDGFPPTECGDNADDKRTWYLPTRRWLFTWKVDASAAKQNEAAASSQQQEKSSLQSEITFYFTSEQISQRHAIFKKLRCRFERRKTLFLEVERSSCRNFELKINILSKEIERNVVSSTPKDSMVHQRPL